MGISLEAKQEAGLKGRVGKQEAFRRFYEKMALRRLGAGPARAGLADSSTLLRSLFPVCPCHPAPGRGASSNRECPIPQHSVLPWFPVASPQGPRHLQLPQPTCPFGLHCLLSIAPSWDQRTLHLLFSVTLYCPALAVLSVPPHPHLQLSCLLK